MGRKKKQKVNKCHWCEKETKNPQKEVTTVQFEKVKVAFCDACKKAEWEIHHFMWQYREEVDPQISYPTMAEILIDQGIAAKESPEYFMTKMTQEEFAERIKGHEVKKYEFNRINPESSSK